MATTINNTPETLEVLICGLNENDAKKAALSHIEEIAPEMLHGATPEEIAAYQCAFVDMANEIYFEDFSNLTPAA